MFRALTKQGEYINSAAACQNGSYFCPVCGQPLQLKASSSKCIRPHFAHLPKHPCTDTWEYDMSEWHLSWQEKFPEECREVVMEKDGEKHRADILIHNTVIEFQHSPIKLKEFQARNQFYLGCGKKLIWIFDISDKEIDYKEFSYSAFDYIKLPRRKLILDEYKIAENFHVFFQKDNSMFLLFREENGEYRILPARRLLSPKQDLSPLMFIRNYLEFDFRPSVYQILEYYSKLKPNDFKPKPKYIRRTNKRNCWL